MNRIWLMFCGAAVFTLLTLRTMPVAAADVTPAPVVQRFHDIFKELVEINTTNSSGNCTVAAQAMSRHLRRAGYAESDMQLIAPPDGPSKGNLVVRLRGTGERRPLLLLAHLDVVEARREDWARDPFKLVEENGIYYGRGTADDKSDAASHVSNMIRYKEEGLKPKRDLIMALTCDEEIVPSPFNGVAYLLKNHRPLIDAEFALNEGGGGDLDKNERLYAYEFAVGEKVYATYEMEVTSPGGHSAVPERDNAIYRLAAGLERLSKFDFPIHLNDTTRAYFDRMSKLDSVKDDAADMHALLADPPDAAALERLYAKAPGYNAVVRTTCTATMLDAGHAENALPQRARAKVNCRILPGESVDMVRKTLVDVLADDKITVRQTALDVVSQPPPLSPVVLRAVESVTAELWPGAIVIPSLLPATTDGKYLNNVGIWTYGFGAASADGENVGVHGLNEHVRVKALDEHQEFLYRLGKKLAL